MWKEIEGHWKQFSVEARRRWDRLSEDDLIECAGERDMLVARLRRAHGFSTQQAAAEVLRLEEYVRTLGAEDWRQAASRICRG